MPSNDHSLESWVRQRAAGLSDEQVQELLNWAAEHLPQELDLSDDEPLVRKIEEDLLMEQVSRMRRHSSILQLRSQPPQETPQDGQVDLDMIYQPKDGTDSSDTTRMDDTDEHDVEPHSADTD